MIRHPEELVIIFPHSQISDVYPRAAENVEGIWRTGKYMYPVYFKESRNSGGGKINNFPGQDWTAPGSFIRFLNNSLGSIPHFVQKRIQDNSPKLNR